MNLIFFEVVARLIVAVCLLLPTLAAVSQNLAIGQWDSHLPLRNAFDLTNDGENIYCAANESFFSFGTGNQAGFFQKFDKTQGLSDVRVRGVDYSTDNQTLVITYANANIDLIKDNTIINISDIERADIVGVKGINEIYFLGDFAYISTSFGVVVLDLIREEIKETYSITETGVNVSDFASDDFFFYAATDEGVAVASRSSPNLQDFQQWEFQLPGPGNNLPTGAATLIEFHGGDIVVEINDTLYRGDNGGWSDFYSQAAWNIANLNTGQGYLIITENDTAGPGNGGRIALFDENFVLRAPIVENSIIEPSQALIDSDSVLWIADLFNNLLFRDLNGTGNFNRVAPSGPFSTDVLQMDIKNDALYVAPGGIDAGFNNVGNTDGFFVMDIPSRNWNNFTPFNTPALSGVANIIRTFADPLSDRIFFGSFFDGLFILENNTVTQLDTSNGLGVNISDTQRFPVTGMVTGNDGTLYISNFNAEDIIKQLPAGDTMMTPVDLSPFNFTLASRGISNMVLDDRGQVWTSIPFGSTQGLLVCNFNEQEVQNPEGYFCNVLTTAEGNGNLHNGEIISIEKDLDGEIWVGTPQGISVFFCADQVLTENGCDAQQILVQNADDEFFGFLLENERIQTITVDGANQKWIGTTNGLWVFSPDGTEQVDFFDTENSPLFSDNILDVVINPTSGEVFIATDVGIQSYMGQATEGTDEHQSEVEVFPNPVTSQYQGPIAIQGLPRDADVKITDAFGHLIFETTAEGGRAIWDGRSLNGNRAKTGVYLIFSSNADGSSTEVSKLLMVK